MTKTSISETIAAPCEAVFDLIHDYPRRLEWDSMLSSACLLGGADRADVGVTSRCVGTWRSAHLALETAYIQFERGRIAAIKLTNQPPLFGHFAATIRHEAIDDHHSRVTYIYAFRPRPQWLAFLLEPVMNFMIRREVRGRLTALRDYFARQVTRGL